jgi:hypothetical protein
MATKRSRRRKSKRVHELPAVPAAEPAAPAPPEPALKRKRRGTFPEVAFKALRAKHPSANAERLAQLLNDLGHDVTRYQVHRRLTARRQDGTAAHTAALEAYVRLERHKEFIAKVWGKPRTASESSAP